MILVTSGHYSEINETAVYLHVIFENKNSYGTVTNQLHIVKIYMVMPNSIRNVYDCIAHFISRRFRVAGVTRQNLIVLATLDQDQCTSMRPIPVLPRFFPSPH